VGNSESQPRSWNAPGPVMVEGPPPKATWESAYKAAAEELASAEKVIARRTSMLEAQRAQSTLYREERDEAVSLLTDARADVDDLSHQLAVAQEALAACEAAVHPDCTDALKAARDAAAGELEAMAQRWRDEE
jgi:hypothetical protein